LKRKFSKILGVGLTLALLTSLLLMAAPVSANVSQPTVDLSDDDISATSTYTLSFRINDALVATNTITVTFPDDTDVAGAGVANITGVTYTSGIGYDSGNAATVTATPDTDDLTVEIKLNSFSNTPAGIGAMAYVQVVITGIINPTEPGAYTLKVQTSEEDTDVESESYDIEAPTVGGFVYVYNSSDILLATYGGKAGLIAAETAGRFTKEGYTIKVGPGTYELSQDLNISGKNLTLESADGAAFTTIYGRIGAGTRYGIYLATNKGITVDGFTIDDASIGVDIDSEDATVTNCVFTDADIAGVQIEAGGLNATVSDNVIEDCDSGIIFADMGAAQVDLDDVDITGNTITEANTQGAIVFGEGAWNVDITGNTITGNEVSGIYFADDGNDVAWQDITISGNTISLNEGDGIQIAEDDAPPTKLVITQNDILDNDDDGVIVAIWDAASDYIMFNNITGNDNSVINNDTSDDINALFNWWGTTDDDEFDEGGTGDIDVEPWLADTQEAVASGSKVAVDGVTSLDAKTAAGVKVSGVDDNTTTKEAAVISAAKYIANPEGALDDAIGFYDVYVALETGFNTTDVTAKLKFYDSAITTSSEANFWTGDFWAECSDQEARDGIIYVTITEDTLPALDELEETIFGVVAGEAVEEGLTAPAIQAPDIGEKDVVLKPTMAWGPVPDAIGYDFELADNTLFVLPIVRMTGDLGRLITPFYACIGTEELDYSTYYYWRVKAVSADAESEWSNGVFFTMAEPVEAIPPVVVQEAPTLPPITIEQPDIIMPAPQVVLPAETPITPSWIYVIIGVGAVLVIALIVLVVRTRRVA